MCCQVLSHHALLFLKWEDLGKDGVLLERGLGFKKLGFQAPANHALEKDLKGSFSGSPPWELVFL